MKSLKSLLLGFAATVFISGAVQADPIQFANVDLDPTAVLSPTGANSQQVCPDGATNCPNTNFVSPAGNEYTITMLFDGLLTATMTANQSPSGSGTFNILEFELFDGVVSLGTGDPGTSLDDVFLTAGIYTIAVVYDYDGGPLTGSAGWAMFLTTSERPDQVPEPATLALMGIALAGVALARRRRH